LKNRPGAWIPKGGQLVGGLQSALPDLTEGGEEARGAIDKNLQIPFTTQDEG
jgi:hypothetical protein